MKKIFIIAFIGLCMVAFMGSCHDDKSDSIVVSTPQQAWILSKITGSSDNIVTLLPSGADAETYEPAISDLKDVNTSRVWFQVGNLPFEDNLSKSLKNANPNLIIVGSPLPDRETIEDDAHLLASIENSLLEARLMADKLKNIFPQNSSQYDSNLSNLEQELVTARDSITSILSNAPSRAFGIWHPSLAYFARENDLVQIAMESHGKESGPRQIRQRLDSLEGSGASVFLVDVSHNPDESRRIAAMASLSSPEIDMADPNIISQLISTAHAIAGK